MPLEEAVAVALEMARDAAHPPAEPGPGVLAPSPSPGYPAKLSEREVEVLRLVAAGLTSAEVAERLYLSPNTVNAHLRRIYRKLGVTSRGAATRFAVAHGLA